MAKSLETSENKLAQKYLKESTRVAKGAPSVFALQLAKASESSPKYHVGEENLRATNKVVMMMGATGSGKTTVINGMINYILGVQWEDNFRFKLIHEMANRSLAESQTSEVTAYVVNFKEGLHIPFSITFIDTPGFGDTRGIGRDRLLIEKIRNFFSTPEGIDHIDSVCFVVKASSNRLTPSQKYVFDSVLSIFGKDIKENIQFLVTFADAETPPVLEAIKTADVPCAKDASGTPVHFRVNNSAFFANNAVGDEGNLNFNRMVWQMGTISIKTFFDSLKTLKTKNLKMTKEVLRERKELETVVQGLPPQIKAGLVKLEELRKTKEVLAEHQEDMEANRDFEYEIKVSVAVVQDLSETGEYATNCKTCRITCHYPCMRSWDLLNRFCTAISLLTGQCNVCPGNCSVSDHCNRNYGYKTEVRKEKRTYEELKKKYEDAFQGVMTTEELLQRLSQEYEEVRENLMGRIQKAFQSLRHLEEIALKPNPLSAPEYIDMLILSEKQEADLGYQERVRLLLEVRKEAELVQKIANKEPLLPEEKDLYEQIEQRKKGLRLRSKFRKVKAAVTNHSK
ncbi:uncharacterized protein LOC133364776 [Rhineura floridana]|uniref:uncharacterized protein LOC133364776 n=1 Tax=Rhineura floridana TaxID=261503 RepID=UPI002AC8055E|nr:uncharacterized protein LOC133364776 [Rhineura floridana]XP_061441559.1 uncharacterized protein LOC133364776 [Rhineura floridana]